MAACCYETLLNRSTQWLFTSLEGVPLFDLLFDINEG